MKRKYLRGQTLIRDLRELADILRNGGIHDGAELAEEAADNIWQRMEREPHRAPRRNRAFDDLGSYLNTEDGDRHRASRLLSGIVR